MRSETRQNDADLDLHHAAVAEQQRTVAPEPTVIALEMEDASDFLSADSDTSSDNEEGPEERADERQEIGALSFMGGPQPRSRRSRLHRQ